MFVISDSFVMKLMQEKVGRGRKAYKQKLNAVLKYSSHPDHGIRETVAMTLGMIPTYDSGMALILLLP